MKALVCNQNIQYLIQNYAIYDIPGIPGIFSHKYVSNIIYVYILFCFNTIFSLNHGSVLSTISFRCLVSDNVLGRQNKMPDSFFFFSVKLNSAEGAKIHLHSFRAIFALICHLCLFREGGSLDLDESVQKIFLTVSCFQSAGRPRKDRHVEGLMCKRFAFTHTPVDILLRCSAFLTRLLLNFNS